jgi:hypothetical protein
MMAALSREDLESLIEFIDKAREAASRHFGAVGPAHVPALTLVP